MKRLEICQLMLPRKEYPLNNKRVTVGRSDDNDIALYRDSELHIQFGAFVYSHGEWSWQGEPAENNGVPQRQVVLYSEDTIKLGAALFSFRTRS